jgi:hypothetical protein
MLIDYFVFASLDFVVIVGHELRIGLDRTVDPLTTFSLGGLTVKLLMFLAGKKKKRVLRFKLKIYIVSQ